MIPADYCSDALGAGSYPEPSEENTNTYTFKVTLSGNIEIEAKDYETAIEILKDMSACEIDSEMENLEIEDYE